MTAGWENQTAIAPPSAAQRMRNELGRAVSASVIQSRSIATAMSVEYCLTVDPYNTNCAVMAKRPTAIGAAPSSSTQMATRQNANKAVIELINGKSRSA